MIAPIITLLFWMFGGIFLAILTSIIIYPIYPNEVITKNDRIIVYSKYQGVMEICCPFEITEKKFWLLEKKIAKVNLNKKFENISIKSNNGNTELIIKYNKYHYLMEKNLKTDTIIELKKHNEQIKSTNQNSASY